MEPLSLSKSGMCLGEIRFNKVKNKQVNKYNNLIRKEGNITGLTTTFSSSQAGRLMGRQAGAPQDSTASQEASTVPPHSTPSQESPSQEGNSLVSQAGSYFSGSS